MNTYVPPEAAHTDLQASALRQLVVGYVDARLFELDACNAAPGVEDTFDLFTAWFRPPMATPYGASLATWRTSPGTSPTAGRVTAMTPGPFGKPSRSVEHAAGDKSSDMDTLPTCDSCCRSAGGPPKHFADQVGPRAHHRPGAAIPTRGVQQFGLIGVHLVLVLVVSAGGFSAAGFGPPIRTFEGGPRPCTR